MSATPHRHASVGEHGGVAPREDVALLLVSHDGARWLPAVLAGIAAQEATVAHGVAVDTGSRDASPDLLVEAFGADAVVAARSDTAFPAAVRLGLARLDQLGVEAEWVWILHDDSNPHPEALLALLAGVADQPGADVLGPMLREWPSLKRLLELGVTISGTGRRETGLERGEYDQGQYSEPRTVLAVNTAGMLVRRRVLDELDGFDDQLPIFGNDLDFGWRAASAGFRTLVVPQAVVFHAEAAHRGHRRTPMTGRHTHYQERRAALFTLLANSRARVLPWQVVRLTFGTLLRMVGFLLVRSPGEALDDLAALVSVFSGFRDIRAARRRRRQWAVTDPAEVRTLLPPAWLPYRHGLDAVGDALGALTRQAADVAERRRAAAAEADPASFAARRERLDLEDDELAEDTGMLARFVTNPVAVALALFVAVVLVAAGPTLGAVAGGGLSPAPEGVGDWWRLHLESWHVLGLGTPVPAPPYLVPFALLATLLLGSPTAAVSVVLVLAVPVGLWGAWRFLRVAGRLASPDGAPRWLILWGAATYSLVSVVAGAWGDGRIGPVVVAALLPWLAHAALGFADPEADRRWRAAWRTGLMLAVAAAFTPVLWILAVLLGAVVVALAFALLPRVMKDRSTWAPPVVALGVVPLLLAPWWLPALRTGASGGLLLDAGRIPAPVADGLDLALGRFGDLGAPWQLGLVLPALAVAALIPSRTRIAVLVCWVVVVASAGVAALLAAVTLDLAAVSTGPGLSSLLVVVQGALVVAVVLGALVPAGADRAWWLVWRRVVAALLIGLALTVPLGGLVWFVGIAETGFDEDDSDIPAYMVQSSQAAPERGILVLRGSVGEGLTYTVHRGDGVTMGEDEVLALAREDVDFTDAVQTISSRPAPAVVDDLAARGIEYVVLPAPADPDVSASLDATSGLLQASADRGTRAWQVDRQLASAEDLDGPASPLRIVLLIISAVAAVVVAVLCAPSTGRRR